VKNLGLLFQYAMIGSRSTISTRDYPVPGRITPARTDCSGQNARCCPNDIQTTRKKLTKHPEGKRQLTLAPLIRELSERENASRCHHECIIIRTTMNVTLRKQTRWRV